MVSSVGSHTIAFFPISLFKTIEAYNKNHVGIYFQIQDIIARVLLERNFFKPHVCCGRRGCLIFAPAAGTREYRPIHYKQPVEQKHTLDPIIKRYNSLSERYTSGRERNEEEASFITLSGLLKYTTRDRSSQYEPVIRESETITLHPAKITL